MRVVSIHVPLAEHDIGYCRTAECHNVSIHVPLAEHDLQGFLLLAPVGVSIHVPLAEHDQYSWKRVPHSASFNSRAPRGARRAVLSSTAITTQVSIHVPLAEHDTPMPAGPSCIIPFQFTCPSRSTTPHRGAGEGSRNRFNSRAPRGARLSANSPSWLMRSFQFTCPSRSTTSSASCRAASWPVSIHVPLAEHDKVLHLIHPRDVVSIHVPLAEHDPI